MKSERHPHGVVCGDCGTELTSEAEVGTRLTDESATDLAFAEGEVIPVVEILCKKCEESPPHEAFRQLDDAIYHEDAEKIAAARSRIIELFASLQQELADERFDDGDVLAILCRAFDDGADEGMEEWRAWYKPSEWFSPQRALGAFIWGRIKERESAEISRLRAKECKCHPSV